MPPKPKRRPPAPRSPSQTEPADATQPLVQTAAEGGAVSLEADPDAMQAGTPPLPAKPAAQEDTAGGGDAPDDVSALADSAHVQPVVGADPSGVREAAPATMAAHATGNEPGAAVSKKPRPPASRPAPQLPPMQSPQPAYSPVVARGQLPEQFMDVDQVGAPSLTELRIVVLRWIKDVNEHGKEFVVYVLEVSAAGHRYKIKRRWSQISEFHAQLKRLNSDLGRSERYKVRFYEKWSSTLDPGQLDGRKAELVTYFRAVTEWAMGPLKHATPPIDLLRVPQVAQFLTFDPAVGDGPGLRISGGGFGSTRLLPAVSDISPTPPEGVPPDLDSATATATEFEVIARFDEPGIMGFDFDRDTLQVGGLQGPAQEVPHAVVRQHQQLDQYCTVDCLPELHHSCPLSTAHMLTCWSLPLRRQEGMVLRWVQHGDAAATAAVKRVNLVPNQPEEFERVVTDAMRPVTLGFAHPWQAHGEGDDRYYYNSYTDESVWEMPQQIVALLESQGADVSSSGDISTASAVGAAGGVIDDASATGGGFVGYTQLRVEIDRLEFTNPADARLIETMVSENHIAKMQLNNVALTAAISSGCTLVDFMGLTHQPSQACPAAAY